MGQKVNPHGLRVGVIKDWDSRWFASKKEFGDILVEDHKIRKTLKKQLFGAGIPKIEIERTVDSQSGAPRVKVSIWCAKPGMVIGKGGAEIEKLRVQLEKLIGKSVNVNIVEVRNMDTNAQLVAENIAGQLERRRLGGADIARTESYHEGTIPLQTLRADIDYGFAEAATTYGRIGVKVWVYKGEVLKGSKPAEETRPPREDRPRRDRGDRKEGGNR